MEIVPNDWVKIAASFHSKARVLDGNYFLELLLELHSETSLISLKMLIESCGIYREAISILYSRSLQESVLP